jgi:hypothetical protein
MENQHSSPMLTNEMTLPCLYGAGSYRGKVKLANWVISLCMSDKGISKSNQLRVKYLSDINRIRKQDVKYHN